MRRPTLSVKRAFIIIVAGILAVGGAWCGHGLLRKHPAHLRILQPNIVDFGVVNEDDVVERSFKFLNDGDFPLSIKRIVKSCACTEAVMDKMFLNPGEQATLNVRYKGRPVTGVDEVGVFIETDAPVQPLIPIKMRGIVRQKVFWQPKTIAFYGEADTLKPADLTLGSSQSDNFQVVSASTSSNRIHVSRTIESPLKLAVTVIPGTSPGSYTDYIHLEVVVNNEAKSLDVPVYSTVLGSSHSTGKEFTAAN